MPSYLPLLKVTPVVLLAKRLTAILGVPATLITSSAVCLVKSDSTTSYCVVPFSTLAHLAVSETLFTNCLASLASLFILAKKETLAVAPGSN